MRTRSSRPTPVGLRSAVVNMREGECRSGPRAVFSWVTSHASGCGGLSARRGVSRVVMLAVIVHHIIWRAGDQEQDVKGVVDKFAHDTLLLSTLI
jgi:hypothetical protein